LDPLAVPTLLALELPRRSVVRPLRKAGEEVSPQQREVKEMLERAYPGGVSNGEFVDRHILRYSARVEELRKDYGLPIACEKRSGSTFIYRLEKRDGGGSGPAFSSLVQKAPAAVTPRTCTIREIDGTWIDDAPLPEWALKEAI
jgi:hypothetical protein